MADDETLIEEELEDALKDVGNIEDWAHGAVLWSTDWTAETMMSQLKRNNIDLDPTFQRRSAWTEKKQSLFIESLILGLPIPQLILAESQTKKGAFIVIDGKQRLLAIRRFCSIDPEGGFSPLKLKGLSEIGRLNSITYSDMTADSELEEYRTAFENSNIRTVVIKNWREEGYLYEVFLRINTGSVQLSPQELRQALHPGPFSQFVNEASADSEELKRALKLKVPDFRMRDAEILLRYIAYRNFIQRYDGNLKNFLDVTTKNLNSEWGEKEDEIKEQVKEFENALKFTREVFTESQYLRKWNGDAFEPRKNRAVFDIMLHYFSRADVRASLEDKHSDIINKFKFLCEHDADFLASIEATTKSIGANKDRFNKWGEVICELSSVNLSNMKFPT